MAGTENGPSASWYENGQKFTERIYVMGDDTYYKLWLEDGTAVVEIRNHKIVWKRNSTKGDSMHIAR